MASRFYAIVAGVGAGTGMSQPLHELASLTPPGRSTALRFAKQYPVVLLARNPKNYETVVDEIKQSGGHAIGITADVADPTSLSQAFRSIKEELPDKKLAAAIFNVNGGFSKKPFLELTSEELDAALDGTVYVRYPKQPKGECSNPFPANLSISLPRKLCHSSSTR